MSGTRVFTIGAGEVVSWPFMVDAAIEYDITALCDDDCVNVDLAAREADGTAADFGDVVDASPVLNLWATEDRPPIAKAPGPPRQLTIEIRMMECRTKVCALGMPIAPLLDPEWRFAGLSDASRVSRIAPLPPLR